MSYFDLDPASDVNSVTNAALNPITPGDLGYGVVRGTLQGTGQGLLQGIVAQPAMIAADLFTPMLMPGAKKFDDYFGGTSAEDFLKSEQQKSAATVHALMPGPQIGTIGRVGYSLGSVVPQAVEGALIGGAIGGPAGAFAGMVTLPSAIQGYSAKRMGETYEGLDPTTATYKGLLEGGATAAGIALPGGFGAKTAISMAFGAATNIGVGMAYRYSTQQLLEARGYPEQAKQYETFDKTFIATDLILGLAFGGLHARGKAKEAARAGDGAPATAPIPDIPPSVVDEALATNKQQHLEIDTAPGVPLDPQSRTVHGKAIDKAIQDVMADEPVDVSQTGIDSAEFVPNRAVMEAQVARAIEEEGSLRTTLDAVDELRAELESRGLAPADEALFGGRLIDGATPLPDIRSDTVGADGFTIIHGSGNPNLTLGDVQIVRANGQKQGKKGRTYGGFYGAHEADAAHATGYAKMMGGTPTIYNVDIRPGTKIMHKEGDVTRLSSDYIAKLTRDGYGLVVGKDPRGRTEYVVIDHSAIESLTPRSEKHAEATTAQLRDHLDAQGARDLPGSTIGRDGEVFVGDRSEPVRFMVVDAGALKATMEKADNQYRDRSRTASQLQITKIANDLQFGRLGEAPTMAEGAPTLAQSGEIVGGNGRVAAIQQAYAGGKGDGYKLALEQRAAEFGLTPEAVRGMTEPVLVRQFTRPVDVKLAAILSNEGGALRMSALEQAKVDAERMPELAGVEMPESGDLTARSLDNFRKQWLSQYPQNELGEFVASDGKLSKQGEKRMVNAILFKAYGDSPALERMVESTDDLSKNLTNALLKSAQNVAEARDMIAVGDLHDLDIQPQLLQAFDTTQRLKAEGVKLDSYLAQNDMFGSGIGPEAVLWMEHFAKNTRSAKAIGEAITGYYDAVRALGNPRQANIFDAQPPSRGEILRAVLKDEPVHMLATSGEDVPAIPGAKLTVVPTTESLSGNARVPGMEVELHDSAGKLIGVVQAKEMKGGSLQVFHSWVDPEHRGKSASGAMYKQLFSSAKEAGYSKLLSDSRVTDQLHGIWERAGATKSKASTTESGGNDVIGKGTATEDESALFALDFTPIEKPSEAAEPVAQILDEKPNAQVVEPSGDVIPAAVALKQADDAITKVDEDAPGYDAAAACASR